MSNDQIKHMVDRFLGWKLPESFNPDGGVIFKRTFNDHLPTPMKHQPSGTNLLDATQADAMVRHMIKGLPPVSTGHELRAAICEALLNAFPMDDKQADAYASVAAKVIDTRRPTLSDEAVERAAKFLCAATLHTAWDGLQEGRITDKGYKPFSYNNFGGWRFQGGHEDIRDIARDCLTAAFSPPPEPVPSSPVPVEAVGWRKIDTAPKDGTPVLLWDDDTAHHDLGRWSEQHLCWHQLQWGTKEPPADADMVPWTVYLPTHWMPLPSAPAHREVGE